MFCYFKLNYQLKCFFTKILHMTVLKFHVDFKAISFVIFLTYRLIKVQKLKAISEVYTNHKFRRGTNKNN